MGIIKKYNKYLESVEEISLDKVFDDCNSYIETIKKCEKGKLLHRGFKQNYDKIKLIEHNWNRQPVDTPDHIHDMVNEWFVEYHGWKARNGVFCVGNNKKTVYGTNYLLFPVGDFNYLYNKNVNDLFGDHEMEMYDSYLPEEDIEDMWFQHCGDDEKCIDDNIAYSKFYDEIIEEYREEFYKHLKNIVKQYQDNNICETFRQEIIVKCDEYYLIPIDYEEEIIKRIWN